MKSDDNRRLVAADVGNSRIKLLSHKRHASFEYNSEWLSEVKRFLQRGEPEKVVVGVSSVEPQRLDELVTIKEERMDVRFVLLNPLLTKKNMPVSLRKVRGMGADRVLGLYGGLRHLSPPFLTVDCGTAITVNILDGDAQCPGGAILPGIGTQLRALHTFTGQLPVVRAASVRSAAGNTTKEAMQIGVVRGAAGAVEHIINRIEQEHFGGNTVPVFITGGEASLIVEERAGNRTFIHREHLVREGILYCTHQLLDSGKISWENDTTYA